MNTESNLRELIDYATGSKNSQKLQGGGKEETTGDDLFYMLVARNDDCVIKSSDCILVDGDDFPEDITLSPGQTPIFGNFRKVVVTAASAGVLEVFPRP